MAMFKCSMCGGEFGVADGTNVLTCPYCGAAQNENSYTNNYAQQSGQTSYSGGYPVGADVNGGYTNTQQQPSYNQYPPQDMNNMNAYYNQQGNPQKKKSKAKPLVIILITVLLVGAIAAAYFVVNAIIDNNSDTAISEDIVDNDSDTAISEDIDGNKYNKEYVDTTGRTIGKVADEAGMSLEEFLAEYDLPADMPEDTYEAAAFYTMPFKTVVEKVYGTDMDTAKEQFGITYYIPDDATYVEVMDKVPLKNVVATSRFDTFKEFYGFGDEVTEDTLYGEVRQVIDEKEKEERIAEEREEDDDSDTTDDNSGETTFSHDQ